MTRRRAFTLVEVMLSLVLLSVVLGAVTNVTLNMQRIYLRQREATAADDALRTTELMLVAVLRSAGANPKNMTGTNAPMLDPDPNNTGTFNGLRAVADFNPPNSSTSDNLEDVLVQVASDTLKVRWTAGGTLDPVAAGVRSLAFEYYASNGVLLTTKTNVSVATRVKVTVTAVEHTRSTVLAQRVFWVNLRNRR
jgi:prepilin-type N-terminal cleavage/methylation domain-containing protein